MSGSHYRWVIVAAGGLLGCIAIGAMFSLPVFLRPISRATGWSITGISSAMTFGFLAMALGSILWGHLSDRFGPRPVVLMGSAALAAALMLASRATSLIEFQLIFGLAVGGATAAIFAPMMACVTGWFDTHRSLAVSLVSAGMGMAPIPFFLFCFFLFPITIGGFFADFFFFYFFFYVSVRCWCVAAGLECDNPSSGPPRTTPRNHSGAGVYFSPIFFFFVDQFFFFCHAFMFYFPYVDLLFNLRDSSDCGGFDLYLGGLVFLGGFFLFLFLCDFFGAKRVFFFFFLLQAFFFFVYYFVRDLSAFYAAAALFGFIYAGVMPSLCGTCTRKFSAAHAGDDHRWNRDGRQPGHGAGSARWRFDLRQVRAVMAGSTSARGPWVSAPS